MKTRRGSVLLRGGFLFDATLPSIVVQSTRFLADAMLGRLARWLRVIGADTLQLPIEAPDVDLVARAGMEDRVLLTRDRHLIRELRPSRAWAVPSEAPLVQLAEVVQAFDLQRPAELLMRCLLCNAPLVDVAREQGWEELPPTARDLGGPVRRCPSCGRLYWRGSHVRRIEAELAAALPGWF